MKQLAWKDACERIKVDDGLPTRSVGAWSEDKLHVWHKYIQQTTMAMSGKAQWSAGLAYVDLFAGPGVCVVKQTGRRLPGSPLIAAFAPKPFEQMIFVDLDPKNAVACESRVKAVSGIDRVSVLRGDCNRVIDAVVKQLPPRALTLAFIDPEGLDVAWETVATLAASRRVDILLLFADAYDAVRNFESFLSGADTRLDRMLGPRSKWRDRAKTLPNWEGPTLRAFFADTYAQQLKEELGYVATATKPIAGPSGPLYKLIYASKSELGLSFWNKVDHRDRHGQSNLFDP